MSNGYGRYGQVWNIPSELLEAGDLGGYSSGCTGCGTAGLAGLLGGRHKRKQFRKWRKSRKARRGARREAETGLSKEERRAGRAARRDCIDACKAQAGFGSADWEDVDETIKNLYMGGFSGNPSTLGYLSNLYMSGFGSFGESVELVSLQEVTKKKFGQAGVDAITNYPFLVRAKIHPDYYMKEDGTKRPADTFSIFMGNKVVAEGVTGRSPVSLEDGTAIYQPAGGGLPKWALPVGIGAVALGGFLWFRSR